MHVVSNGAGTCILPARKTRGGSPEASRDRQGIFIRECGNLGLIQKTKKKIYLK